MKIYILLTLTILLNGCSNDKNKWWDALITYEVTRTKTNVTIKYRDITYEGSVENELATTTVKKLPFRLSISSKVLADKSKNIKGDIWFLSASSDSEGEIILKIARDFLYYYDYYYDKYDNNYNTNFTYSNESVLYNVVASNMTKEKYAEVSINEYYVF